MRVQCHPAGADSAGMPKPRTLALLPTANGAELRIIGDIGGPDWSSPTNADEAAILDQLAAMSGISEIHVSINSYGGSVSAGLAIYNALKVHPARIVVTVTGVAASIASLVAMAADEVRMYEASLIMVHGPWFSNSGGNAAQLRAAADELEAHAKVMAVAYAEKSGRSEEEILPMLMDGTDHFFTAKEAVAFGLADQIIGGSAEIPEVPAGAPPENLAARVAAAFNRIRGATMPNPNPAASRAAPAVPAGDPMAALIQRNGMLRGVFAGFRDMDGVARLEADLLADPTVSLEHAQARLLAHVGQGASPVQGTAYSASQPRAGDDFNEAAADALLLRSGLSLRKPHAAARDLVGMSIGDIANTVLSRAGKTVHRYNMAEAIRAAMTTSDFTRILANSATKALRNGYEIEPQSHVAWVLPTTVPDFKTQHRPIIGSAPELLAVPESAEYQFGSMDEDQAEYAVSKWGRSIRLTFEAVRNDDLGAFARAQQAMGQAAKRREADEVYALLLANAGAGQTMQDTKTLFHVDHGNLTASASALDVNALGAARTLLRKQTALGGGLLNLQPRFLLVPAELESIAEMLLAASTRHMQQSGAVEAGTPNWLSSLQLVVEPRLGAGAAYVMAAPPQIDTFELAMLDGDNGPVVIEEPLTNSDDLQYRVRHVFGGRFLDWRGVVKIPISE